MADVQRLAFSDELTKEERLRVEAGYITALLLQHQGPPIADKFGRVAPRVVEFLSTGVMPSDT